MQFLNLIPVPVEWYWSFSQTISDEFVPDVVVSIAVPFGPPKHKAAQSESGVTSSEQTAVANEKARKRFRRDGEVMMGCITLAYAAKGRRVGERVIGLGEARVTWAAWHITLDL